MTIKETLNYTKFYEAIEKLTFELSNLNISTTFESITLEGQCALINPTDYYGLELIRLDFEIAFFVNDSVVELATDTKWSNAEPINPHSNITFPVLETISISTERGKLFLQASSLGPVECMAQSRILLATFFGPSTNFIEIEPQYFTYQKQQSG